MDDGRFYMFNERYQSFGFVIEVFVGEVGGNSIFQVFSFSDIDQVHLLIEVSVDSGLSGQLRQNIFWVHVEIEK